MHFLSYMRCSYSQTCFLILFAVPRPWGSSARFFKLSHISNKKFPKVFTEKENPPRFGGPEKSRPAWPSRRALVTPVRPAHAPAGSTIPCQRPRARVCEAVGEPAPHASECVPAPDFVERSPFSSELTLSAPSTSPTPRPRGCSPSLRCPSESSVHSGPGLSPPVAGAPPGAACASASVVSVSVNRGEVLVKFLGLFL